MTGNLAEHPLVEQKSSVTRRNFLVGSAAAAVGGLGLYSGEIARHEINIVTQSIALDNLPDAFHGFRIVQISDIHYDEFTEPSFVRRIIAQVNSLAPDLVAFTGDYISFGPLPRNFGVGAMHRCAAAMNEVTCPLRFAIMGNHDSFLGAPTIRPILAEVNIPLLVNRYVPIDRGGQRLWLCGVADVLSNNPNLHFAIPEKPDGPVLLMCHAPDYADFVLAHPRGRMVDFMLAGHSHGGQVRLPLIGPISLPPMGKKYVEGLFRFDHMQLYVNRGIGTVGLPFRLNCPPEITVLTLQNS